MAKTPAKKTKASPKKATKKVTKVAAKKPVKAAAKPTKAAEAQQAGRLAGYVVLSKGKPLALTAGEGTPKGGVLDRNERATLFARLLGAQAALRRTAKHNAGNARALNADQCDIVRVDLPAG